MMIRGMTEGMIMTNKSLHVINKPDIKVINSGSLECFCNCLNDLQT